MSTDTAERTREIVGAVYRSESRLGCNRLQPPHAAITVRVRDGKVTITDGPFVETKEQLGGYYLIEARDLNEAIQVAARVPGARIGCVEVRPIAEDQRTLQALGFVDPEARHSTKGVGEMIQTTRP